MSYYNSTSASGYTLSINTTEGTKPGTPPGLIVTAAAQTMQGWFGQVIVDKVIVWESDLCEDADDAIRAANRKVVDTVRGLFVSPAAIVNVDGPK